MRAWRTVVTEQELTASGSATRISAVSVLAEKVRFVGSPEHKRLPNPLCNPALHSDNSDCDEVDDTISHDPQRLLTVLREAVRRGQVDRVTQGQFPRYVWGWIRLKDGSRALFEARLTNCGTGEFKAYFIDLDEESFGDPRYAWVRAHLADGGQWCEVLG